MNGINADPEVRVARHTRGGYYVVGLAGLLVAVGCLVTHHNLSAENNWIKIDGDYMGASVRKDKYKDLQITYKYNVGGKTYTATEVENSNNQEHLLEQIKARYEKNPSLAVYYNPSNPTQSRLGFVSLTTQLNLYLLVGLLGAIVFLASLFALLKLPRNEP
ncbi:MAG: DUF3592 domain-containing protein [Cyanobacteria bacterium SZAS LIN-2]|nr:DUF3592 domain-containing protein [Cyanobacteria bacterium SZAS LIN-3]MBS1996294.1 DUF3592 domain-containing protein [Cyanobacteria bacterium SZAS LIN-2]